jgi:inositol oxygenase
MSSTTTTSSSTKRKLEETHENAPSKKLAQQKPHNLLDSAELRGLGPIEDDEENNDTGDASDTLKTARTEPFRNYEDSSRQQTVQNFYHQQHRLQTVEWVKDCEKKFLKLDKAKMSLWEAAEFLNEIVDDSDPDTEANQIIHLVQTGESLRMMYPDLDWLHLTGFIHDLGKLLAHPKMHNLEQYFVVGDTYPVGCAFDPNIVFSEYFKECPDNDNPQYNTKLGIYKEHCGLDNVHMTFGHDEYMYQVCIQNGCTLPEEALYIIRYHSFYSWHDKSAYDYLCNDKDRQMLDWVRKFQKHDLYSKLPEKPDLEKTLPYYKKLMAKYFPPVLKW